MEMLNSELPINDLMRLSRELAPNRHMKAFNVVRKTSVILNREIPKGVATHSCMLDLGGIKSMLAKYQDNRVIYDDMGNAVPVGNLPNTEYRLREMWRQAEYTNKVNGRPLDQLPRNPLAEDIAEVAAQLKLLREEERAMEKVVREAEAKEEATVKARRKRNGNCKRDTGGRITQVDGMWVDMNGIIEETGQPTEEYLAEVKAEKEAKKARRKAAA